MGKLYSSTKIFHFPDRLSAVENNGIPAPVHIRLKPTNRCNHRCTYCCYRSDKLFLGQLMDEEDQIPAAKMSEIVNDFRTMGVKAVTFSGGGEPLFYPHIKQTVESLTDAGIKVAMLSNGGLLHGEIASIMARRAIWLRVSMDAADSASYAASRGVGEGEFAKVCRNLEKFAATSGRRCVLGLNLIVTRDNSNRIWDFLKMVKDLGVDHVKVSGVVVSTEPDQNDLYHLPIHIDVRRQLDRALTELIDDKFSIIDLYHTPGERRELYQKNYHSCPMCRFLVVIGADQQVYTCQDKAYTDAGLLGSLKERSFSAMWQSKDTSLRIQQLDPSRDCRHNCVAHNKNLMLLDYLEADPDHLEFV